jgi:hypothetical protein
MPPEKNSPIVRWLPSLTDFAFLMPVIFVFVGMQGAKTLLGDGDTGWHVRTGEWILRHGYVPHHDLFSYTKSGQPWFAWEWLWDVIFAWLHQHGGMAAVVLASMLVISLTSALLFRLVFRKSGNPLIAIAATFLAVAGSSIHFLARPHLFTLLFCVIFYSLLERVREEHHPKLLLWLPLLTILWTNLHGGFFVGIVLACIYAAGELAGGLFERQPGAWRAGLQRALPYAGTALLCLVASLAGPYTWHLHVHIFRYLTDSFQRQHIMEFLPISFQNPAARYFEIMVLAGGAATLWHLRRKRYTAGLLLVAWAHLGLIASRNIPLFAIVAAPLLAWALAEWLQTLEQAPVAAWLVRLARGIRSLGESAGEMEVIPRLHLASAAAMLLIAAVLYAPAPPPKFRATFDAKTFPTRAVASLKGPGALGRIFTYDQWGDYLIYNLYPRSRVFIDGRSDFYGSKFVETYLDIVNVKYDWQQHLDHYGVNTVLLPTDAPLAGALKESSRWHVVYDDGEAIVFRSGPRPEGTQVSAAIQGGGKERDRKITRSAPRDPTITKTKT